MVVIDPKEHQIAVQEAQRAGVPIIAFANVDADPDNIQYVVPGNNRGRKSVAWFLEGLREALLTPRRAPTLANAADEKSVAPVAANEKKAGVPSAEPEAASSN